MTLTRFAGDHTNIYCDDSGGSARLLESPREVDVEQDAPELDVTSFNDGVQPVVPGVPIASIAWRGHVDDAASTGDHTVLAGVAPGKKIVTLTVQLGQNAAPTTGDPEFEGEFYVLRYNIHADVGSPQTYEAYAKPADETALSWGTVT